MGSLSHAPKPGSKTLSQLLGSVTVLLSHELAVLLVAQYLLRWFNPTEIFMDSKWCIYSPVAATDQRIVI